MIDTFLIKLTRFEETGSIGKIFISVGNMKTNFHFQKQKPIMFFGAITFLLFDRGVCLKKGNTLNLRSHKSIREKVNLSMKKKTEKNHHDLYKSLNCVHRLLIESKNSR